MKIAPPALPYREAHELIVGAVVPRPIAFVSTVGIDGILDVAPYSFFSVVCVKPTLLGFNSSWRADGQKKRTLRNIEATKEYVINVVTESIAERMNQASANYPAPVDKFKQVGLTPLKADIVRAPLVAESPVNMECRLLQVLEFGEPPRRASFIIGEVLLVHVKDELYANNEIQMPGLKAIARMSAQLYCRTGDIFEMKSPDQIR